MIAQALKHDGPALVEVLVGPPGTGDAAGRSHWSKRKVSVSFMLKAVLNGRGDEIIDLARVNLLR